MTLANLGGHIEDLTTAQDIWDAALGGFQGVGLDLVIYLTARSDRSIHRLRTNFPEIYSTHDPAEDPFLDYCCTNYAPTKIGADYLPDYDYLPEGARGFIRQISALGFRTGLSVPVRLDRSDIFGGFNLGSRMARDAFETSIWPLVGDLQTFCLILHRRLEEVGLVATDLSQIATLTTRQAEVVTCIAEGLSRKEIARRFGISPNTVAEYTRAAYLKLGVSNRVEATRLILSAQRG